jgi:hypothetical protein
MGRYVYNNVNLEELNNMSKDYGVIVVDNYGTKTVWRFYEAEAADTFAQNISKARGSSVSFSIREIYGEIDDIFTNGI